MSINSDGGLAIFTLKLLAMKRRHYLLLGVLCAGALLMASALNCFAEDAVAKKLISPIYGVAIPDGYRQWPLIAPALEDAPLNELRAVLGNKIAIDAYRTSRPSHNKKTRPFPDGTILVKLAWQRRQSPEFAAASIPGAATTVQIMRKDAKKYAASGGWGFGRFVDGKPVDEAQHRTCFACHEALAKDNDYVFTRYAQ